MENKSYQNVLKATSIFGGVQVIRILITIVRSKVIALLLGPEGVGISNLLTRPLQLITTATQLGLDKSAVKEISSQNLKEGGTPYKFIFVLRKLVRITAVVGALFMIAFSRILSIFTFDTDTYTIPFIWLGLAVIFNQFAMSNLAILQGLRRLKFLAKANIYGSIVGLLATIPLYYYYELDGILPAIIVTSGSIFMFSYFYARKVLKAHAPFTTIENKNFVSDAKPMVKLGVALGFSSMISLLAAYLILVYIRSSGGENEAGFYAAGMVILNTYVGLIFNAMATDYFPRLGEICDDIKKVIKVVFEQAFIALLIITPIIILFIAFAPIAITVLYSGEFQPTTVLLRWAILGMLFKTVSWSMGYVIIAKGDSGLFVKTAIGFNALLFTLNSIGYHYWGLQGVGMSLLLYFVIHFVIIKLLVTKRYGLKMDSLFYPIFIKCIVLCGLAFFATFIQIQWLKYVVLGCFVLLSLAYSYRLLDEKVGFMQLINTLMRRTKK